MDAISFMSLDNIICSGLWPGLWSGCIPWGLSIVWSSWRCWVVTVFVRFKICEWFCYSLINDRVFQRTDNLLSLAELIEQILLLSQLGLNFGGKFEILATIWLDEKMVEFFGGVKMVSLDIGDMGFKFKVLLAYSLVHVLEGCIFLFKPCNLFYQFLLLS